MRGSGREAALADLIGELYRAVGDPGHWPLVLSRFSSVIDCAAVILFAVNQRTRGVPVAIAHDCPEESLREHEEHYVKIDPRQACCLAHRDQPVYDYMHVTEAEIDRSEYYAWHRRNGFRYYIGAALAEVDGIATYLGLQRSARQGHVGEHEIATFARLLPHLKQAVALSTTLQSLKTQAGAFVDALHASGTAMILLNRDRRVAFMTEAAERIAARADGLLVDREGRVRASRPEESAQLRRLIADVAQTATANGARAEGLVAGGELFVSRPSGREPLRARVAPLRDLDATIVGVPAAAALIIHDPEARPRPIPDRLCRRHGLTPAEAKLAVALADGTSLKEYAESAGITYETARWHLKRALAKTDTHRQPALVSLVLQKEALP